ncbi:uncharacterized protein LOC114530879 [Dendronephthya gigantea]|uniref:uncharacterized protein LOC114530879 n=1 Tax=Dendronephthya gigantea TaxID=151771 RepID=UPI00106C00DF|nr:uncharacterized protein LOC114530879 [Dendronephthya gigantea]
MDKNPFRGNPSKRHRDRLNTELDNLAKLLPFPEDTISKLDKISILRLTVSYLKAKSYFQVCETKRKSPNHAVDQNYLSQEFEGNGLMSQLLLEALDGFIMIITTDGQLFYVSESVKDFLGYSQATLIHQSLYKFLHIDDHKTVRENLVWVEDCDTTTGNLEDDQADDKFDDVFASAKREKNFACRIKCTMSHGGGFYKMFQCRGRMREIHIKKREVDSVEYGLFAVISPINTLPTSSTLEMVRKEAMLASQRRYHLSDQNLNLTETYPLSSPYKPFIDPRHLHIPPITPTTPTAAGHEASFFPPNFTYGNGNLLRPGIKRRNSSSSAIADDSSTNDENASSEGSVDSTGARRRVSFRLDEEKSTEKREKIGSLRRMSAPAFANQPMTSPSYETTSYNNMLHPGTPNWLYPTPFSNPLLGYQELLHRMESRSYLSPGYLSPLYPPFSPGGMFPPYSPFLKRASSFPNISPNGNAMYPNGDSLLSPRIPPYDPFAYFLGNPQSSRSSSNVSPSGGMLGHIENGKEAKAEEKVNENVEAMEEDSCTQEIEVVNQDEDEDEINVTEETEVKLQIPTIKIEHCDSEPMENDEAGCSKVNSVYSPSHDSDISSAQPSPSSDTSNKQNEGDLQDEGDNEDGIQETLADIAHNFTSKLDSIRSTFTLSLDRNVASCLGKNK